MTIDQLEAVGESLELIQDRADMEHAATVLAPRLLTEVWRLHRLLTWADKYLAHTEDCGVAWIPSCTCHLNDLLDAIEKAKL